MDLTRDEIGRLIGLTGRRVTQMADEGKIPKPVNGKYNAPAVIRALLNGAKERRAPTPLEKAQAKRAEEIAAEIADRRAAKRGELIAVDAAVAIFDELVAAVRSEIVGLPARVTRDMALRRKLEDEVDASLGRIARRCGDAANDARTGRAPSDAEAEDDA